MTWANSLRANLSHHADHCVHHIPRRATEFLLRPPWAGRLRHLADRYLTSRPSSAPTRHGVPGRDIDSEDGAFDYEALDAVSDGEWPFAVIARDALAAGLGTSGRVGVGESHAFEAPALVRFAVDWIERAYGD